jgi:uncharacterized cupin superfamily protein|tara:strand:+ start:684 stop:1067 length:384 start_codon:yes stop_codon:yes gene_type:complete
MKTPVHESDVPWQVWYQGTDREVRGKALSDTGGHAKVGFGLMELPPGSNTRPPHYHSHEEEHLMALSGTANLHLGSTVHKLGPGSYVCFPAGQRVFHHLENIGDQIFRYIMVGERIKEDTVVHEDNT